MEKLKSALPGVALLLAFAFSILATAPAAAAGLDGAIERLKKNSFKETGQAIEEIAASGAGHAGALLEALGDRRLKIAADGTVHYLVAAGQAFDALSGTALASPPEGGKSARVNNRLRNAIAAALGALRLSSPDPARRLAAASAVFQSRSAEDLEAVRAALAKESDATVAKAFAQAEAAILVASSSAPQAERIDAIETLVARADQEAIAVLSPALADGDQAVAEAARAGIKRIEETLQVLAAVQNIWYGLSLGSVLLLAAIGLAITFVVMCVINMAHGEMVMLGAYTTFVVQEAFRAYAPGAFDLSLPVAIPLAFLTAGAIGVAIERGIIRFLYGRPLETLLATWGVSLILQQAVRTIFGPTNREVGAPSYMTGAFDFMGLSITYGRLWIIVFTLLVFVGLLLVLKATPLGLQMRAVTQNRRMASSMGIRTGWVDAMTFGLGSGIAGIAGVALSQIDNVSPNLGQTYIIDSFMVVVFGGVGSLWGTLVSAFALGIANKFMEPFAGAVLAKIFILVLLILFIQKRPRGLFALKGRAVES